MIITPLTWHPGGLRVPQPPLYNLLLWQVIVMRLCDRLARLPLDTTPASRKLGHLPLSEWCALPSNGSTFTFGPTSPFCCEKNESTLSSLSLSLSLCVCVCLDDFAGYSHYNRNKFFSINLETQLPNSFTVLIIFIFYFFYWNDLTDLQFTELHSPVSRGVSQVLLISSRLGVT